MRQVKVGSVMHAVSRIALIGAIGSIAAGCSGEVRRFAENPFQNPFKSFSDEPEPGMTGSIAPKAQAVPRGNVSSAPLAAAPRVAAAPAYNQPAAPAPLASAAPRPAASASRGGWSSEGGTLLTLRKGDTLTSVSERYGVPPAAILSTNNISAAQIAPGQRVVIPVYSATARTAAAAPAPSVPSASAVQGTNPSEGRVVASTKIAPTPKVVAAAPKAAPAPKVAAVAPEAPKTRVRPGMAPAPAKVAAAPAAKVALVEPKTTGSVEPKKADKPVAKAPEPKVVAAAKAEPAKVQPKLAKVAETPKAAPAPAKVAATEPAKPVKEPETTASAAPAPAAAPSAEFRWPARGRVIAGFGGGGSNEGVNIAVPEGTPVKAAEGGTVAYAGSEVKGYGNLVLIRHDNGYVSAYAHNGDIDVKRGQKVTRGQTIAKSGQTGNVTSPQLHFEIRKGSTPVDPMKYLASN